jgi:hypothetical protein
MEKQANNEKTAKDDMMSLGKPGELNPDADSSRIHSCRSTCFKRLSHQGDAK